MVKKSFFPVCFRFEWTLYAGKKTGHEVATFIQETQEFHRNKQKGL